ncbi:DUF99 family protein [Pleurocapsa sp. PCC 7319]|uniref:endonuclease dU n=1 Tax=Pleurocapsa sp. PCC 7319 TaxID=118161 RepID=UPI00036693C3|nr:DUF99 family protein [Pleurocapsa sp. PCC 7319]
MNEKKLDFLLRHNRQIRVIGFDDAPFERHTSKPVAVAGVVCSLTRFEGMLWGHIQADGWDSTEQLAQMLLSSKFHAQLHLVLLDGISMGGLNLIELPNLAQQIQLPCVAVMRKFPKLSKMKAAISLLPEPEKRLQILAQAGEIQVQPPFYFQVCGLSAVLTARILQRLTDKGNVPEALRIAHLITSAVLNGESGKRA